MVIAGNELYYNAYSGYKLDEEGNCYYKCVNKKEDIYDFIDNERIERGLWRNYNYFGKLGHDGVCAELVSLEPIDLNKFKEAVCKYIDKRTARLKHEMEDWSKNTDIVMKASLRA